MASIAILTSRFPYPLEKGDKLRIYNQVKSLSEKHQVHLICLSRKKASAAQYEALKPYCKSIHTFILPLHREAINLAMSFFGKLPLQVGMYHSKKIHNQIARLFNEIKPDAIYCHLIRMAAYARNTVGSKTTIDYMDAFSLGMKRRSMVSRFPFRQIFQMEYKRLVNYEKEVFQDFNERVIISRQDQEAIQHPENTSIHIIPNGVDFSTFAPLNQLKKYDLLFTGNMAYPPNIEAALYAAKKILPLIHKKNPAISMLIAGINPPVKIRQLASDRIFVIENFNHIRDAFHQSKIMIAPMLISIGLQNKILQAMAMKIPTIASTLANNAISARNGLDILEANTPEEFSATCLRLLNEPGTYLQLQENGYTFVKQNFSWDLHNKKLEQILLP